MRRCVCVCLTGQGGGSSGILHCQTHYNIHTQPQPQPPPPAPPPPPVVCSDPETSYGSDNMLNPPLHPNSVRLHLSYHTTHPLLAQTKQQLSFLSAISLSLSVCINPIGLSLSHTEPDASDLPRTDRSVPTHSSSLPAAHTISLRTVIKPAAASAAIFCP